MSDGALAIRQRIRAPLRFAEPASRTSQQGTPDRSDATASRRVAVKSSTRGSPQISPTTQDRAEHLTPSSIAHSASRASRVSTWMRLGVGSPGGWIRPDSMIAIRSWIHRRGLAPVTCASRNPAHPPSRGCVANSSERVLILPRRGRGTTEGGGGGWVTCTTPPPPFGRAEWPPSPPSGEETSRRAETAPPATKERPAATRLTTLMFYFCSCPATRGQESRERLVRTRFLDFFQELADLMHGLAGRFFRNSEGHVSAIELDGLVPFIFESARRPRGDQAVLARP